MDTILFAGASITAIAIRFEGRPGLEAIFGSGLVMSLASPKGLEYIYTLVGSALRAA